MYDSNNASAVRSTNFVASSCDEIAKTISGNSQPGCCYSVDCCCGSRGLRAEDRSVVVHATTRGKRQTEYTAAVVDLGAMVTVSIYQVQTVFVYDVAPS